ncbi:MAG: response regulator [Coleofasciculus sp. S288]|nr:response regulator [Coleofasciculus sp. S288]
MTKILVIEDEAQTRNSFLKCLNAEGFKAIGAENGFIGIQRAQEQLSDLVICDIIMPELDGYTVLTTLRQNPVTAIIPFIFLTAKPSKAEFRQAMELGADDYLTKPSTAEELLRAIAAQLEKQAALRQWYALEYQQVPEPPTSETVKLADSQPFFPTCPKLGEVFDFIEANHHQPITLNDVARAVGYSPAYLTDLVRRQTGQTVQRWIIKRRMAAACSLLLNTNQAANQIAEAVGYNDKNYFFYQFRQYHGMTPQMWRKTQRTPFSTDQELKKF